MKILVCGSEGNMGKRYCAILKYLMHEVITYDQLYQKDTALEQIIKETKPDKAIVATPTNTHFEICKKLIENKINFLCEKPVSMFPDEIKELIKLSDKNGVSGCMVNNWRYVSCNPNYKQAYEANKNCIIYDFYNTGKDGLYWDCIQLIYLAEQILISKNSPEFYCRINDRQICLDDISMSYIVMLKEWLTDSPTVWNLQDALAATVKVISYAFSRSKLCS